ncbi:uncharacterized protein LOC129376519 [Poeciliopsis prolifica]|uniref:uncharacterized protein LOC129376519 n=1 Tax=Poeciliopsis prolifica TaxID=188132 RepID=UPI00241418CB|nr:uncharacterized protein LOC129376519 [Poeciliopsis prolifica]
MKETSVRFLLLLTSVLSRAKIQVALTVNPSRSQFFEEESVTLICEDENRSAGWTVRRNTSRGTRKPCGDGWGKADGSTCNMTYLIPEDSGLYWCESGSSSSSTSSSSSSSSSLILQSPVLPVMEGDDVTLSCRARNPTHNLPAAFYKDGSFIGDGSAGSMTLLHVSSSDEGSINVASAVLESLHPAGSLSKINPSPPLPPAVSLLQFSSTWSCFVRTSSPLCSWCLYIDTKTKLQETICPT